MRDSLTNKVIIKVTKGCCREIDIASGKLWRLKGEFGPMSEILMQVKDLAQEVIDHLREVAGPDALITAFNAARQSVTANRAERKRRQALQVTKMFTLSHSLLACCYT